MAVVAAAGSAAAVTGDASPDAVAVAGAGEAGTGSPADGGAHDAASVDSTVDLSAGPLPMGSIDPIYPAEALKSRAEGDVVLILTVGGNGLVSQVDVEAGLRHGLTEAAVAAARVARFRAGRDARGQPVAMRIRWIVHFTLPEVRQAAGAARPVDSPSAPPPEPLPPNVERFSTGPSGSLAVLVRERGTGKLLPNATIFVEDLGELVHLDEKARAERPLSPGAYAVIVRAPGHHQEERIERIHPGQRLARTYFIEKERLSQYETIIHAPPARAETGVVTLQAEEIHNMPGTFGDPFRAVMLLPGVGSIVSGLGYPVIRGESPGQTGTFIDDVKVPLLYHLGAGPAVVHPLYIEELEFHAGDFPAEYGRFTGGLIRVKTTGAPEEAQTVLEADLVKFSGFHSQPFTWDGHEGAVTVSARYGTLGFLARAFSPNTVLDYWDYQTRVDLRAGPGALRLLIFGSDDVAGTQQIDDDQGNLMTPADLLHVGFHRADLRYRFFRSGGLAADVGIEGGADYTTNSGSSSSNGLAGGVGPTPEARAVEWVVRPRAQIDYLLSDRIKLRAGADLLYQKWNNQIGDSVLSRFSFAQYGITFGGFAQAEWQPSPGWLVVAGLRADHYYYAHLDATASDTSVDPRLAVRRRIRPGLFVKGTAGIYHSPPRFIVPWPALEGFGLAENGLNRSYQLSLGAELALPWEASIEGQIYYNWLPRVTEYDFQSFSDADPLDKNIATHSGRSYGLELIARRRLGQRLFGWVSYTFGRAERDYQQAGWRPADFDQTHIINTVASYALGRSWTVSGTFHYNTGRPYTPGIYEPSGNSAGTLEADRNADRLPSFWRIDARIEKREAFDTWYLDFYIDWLNISLQREVVGYGFSSDQQTMSLVRQSQTALVTVPTFGLRFVF